MRDFFFKDWAWKWFSLALAVAIWFNVHRILLESSSPQSPSNVGSLTINSLPVTLVSTTGDVRSYRPLQLTVSVTVSGPHDIIDRLQANQIHALVDLTDTNTVATEKQRVMVAVPPGVTLFSQDPETIGILPPP